MTIVGLSEFLSEVLQTKQSKHFHMLTRVGPSRFCGHFYILTRVIPSRLVWELHINIIELAIRGLCGHFYILTRFKTFQNSVGSSRY